MSSHICKEEQTNYKEAGLGVFGAIVLSAIIWMFVLSDWSSTESRWSAFAALATLSASIVALWLGLSGARKRKAANEKRAAVIAAGALVRLRHVQGSFRLSAGRLMPGLKYDFFGKENLDTLHSHLSNAAACASDDELVLMLPLPENFSLRVAAVKAEAAQLCRLVEINKWWSQIPNRPRMAPELAKAWGETIRKQLYELDALIKEAEAFCGKLT